MSITEIAGYRVMRQLGAGGMGQVFLVEHPRLPRRDALKLLDTGVSRNDDFKARFQREADLLAQLSHPNIVTLYDRGEYDDRLWITMEFVEGTDAGQLVESNGPLPLPLALTLVEGAGSALDHAWRKQQITHRDVKPANLLVTLDTSADEPVVEAVKLADFGIAKAAEEATSLTSTGVTVGTMAYISPEAIEGDVVDNRSDIYSLGCTAFHLITGQAPFIGKSMTSLMSGHLNHPAPAVSQVLPSLPAALDPVFARVLAKNPDDRYQTCAEFVSALSDAMNGVAPASFSYAQTLKAPTQQRAKEPRSHRTLWLSLLTAACVFGAIAIAGSVVYLSGKNDSAVPVAASSTPQRTTTITRTTTSPTPTPTEAVEAEVVETTPTEEPVTATVPTTPEPYEGQPCGPDQFNQHNSSGTLYCSAMNGAWTDLTHQSRPAVERGSACSEPGARARIAQTDSIATCQADSDGSLVWRDY
ncbi:serine/threonine-protein kinase [Gordonia hydrophobica]|uniref:non-specific serine/threonine protein kinase n=1 Tax=Gordonia hydrophobica TaxID=40516 RepID=A0ABZ2U7Y0_9ACTN|nr:serine/threonine-protein kinase [Gordonia hydrophobica]MBM7368271.1 serine/threonine-protein kinase [Gordonia hydrophobica]